MTDEDENENARNRIIANEMQDAQRNHPNHRTTTNTENWVFNASAGDTPQAALVPSGENTISRPGCTPQAAPGNPAPFHQGEIGDDADDEKESVRQPRRNNTTFATGTATSTQFPPQPLNFDADDEACGAERSGAAGEERRLREARARELSDATIARGSPERAFGARAGPTGDAIVAVARSLAQRR